jgi:hypothetical protein
MRELVTTMVCPDVQKSHDLAAKRHAPLGQRFCAPSVDLRRIHPCTFPSYDGTGAAKMIRPLLSAGGAAPGAVGDVEDALIYVQFMDDFLRHVGTALH